MPAKAAAKDVLAAAAAAAFACRARSAATAVAERPDSAAFSRAVSGGLAEAALSLRPRAAPGMRLAFSKLVLCKLGKIVPHPQFQQPVPCRRSM